MTADYFEETLDAFAQTRPFQVFVIELHGGTRYEIDHPGALSYRDGKAAFILPGGRPVWFDHESVNQIFLGTAREIPPLPGANPAAP